MMINTHRKVNEWCGNMRKSLKSIKYLGTIQAIVFIVVPVLFLSSVGVAANNRIDPNFNSETDRVITPSFHAELTGDDYLSNSKDSIQTTVNFHGTPNFGLVPLSVTFQNESTGSFDSCYWDLGDGYTATDCSSLVHTYTNTGYFTVSLTVYGEWGSETVVKHDYIAVGPFPTDTPHASRTPSITPSATLTSTPTNKKYMVYISLALQNHKCD